MCPDRLKYTSILCPHPFSPTFSPCKARSCSLVSQSHTRTPIFPAWAKPIPSPSEYSRIPACSRLRPPPACSSLLGQEGRLQNWLWSCSGGCEQPGPGSQKRCRLPQHVTADHTREDTDPAAQVNTHSRRKAGAIAAQCRTGTVPVPPVWEAGTTA